MGLERPSPFRDISIKTEKTLKRSLDPVVIKTLSAIELEKDSPLSLARDIFMFSFYTRGMSFVDIALLKKRHVFPGEICYRRHKTDQLMRVGINKEISRILETARGDGKVHSAQDTLPFRQMYPDGLCKLDEHTR